MSFGNLFDFVIFIPAILIAIVLHEFAHGYVAFRLGDPTPKYQGRLTLNPLAHLDPLGTLLLIFAHFGWAKPVQVNPLYFRGDKRKGMIFVSLAGPLTNFILAFLAAGFIGLMMRGIMPENTLFLQFFQALVQINLILAAFNLIPVPPLDGSKILAGILPSKIANYIYQMESYGPVILMLLIITGTTQVIFMPIVSVLAKIISVAMGIIY